MYLFYIQVWEISVTQRSLTSFSLWSARNQHCSVYKFFPFMNTTSVGYIWRFGVLWQVVKIISLSWVMVSRQMEQKRKFSIGNHLTICKHNVAFSQAVRTGFKLCGKLHEHDGRMNIWTDEGKAKTIYPSAYLICRYNKGFSVFWQLQHMATIEHKRIPKKILKYAIASHKIYIRATEILKSKLVRSTDDVIGVIRTCVQQSQIVTKTNDSSFSTKRVSEIDYFSNSL